ncbi:MAG: fluoride efflux transporter CrcB [Prevotella sp.]|nr:fluoride efflux transporter CrcB [Prevotella sp.]
MFKDFLIVGAGSFLGGGLRFLISKGIAAMALVSFPFGTFTVNVLGCLLIGLLSGLSYPGGMMSPATKLLLTTGFCGGFTTFSTFMNENASLLKDDNTFVAALYILASLVFGFIAVALGHWLSKFL